MLGAEAHRCTRVLLYKGYLTYYFRIVVRLAQKTWQYILISSVRVHRRTRNLINLFFVTVVLGKHNNINHHNL